MQKFLLKIKSKFAWQRPNADKKKLAHLKHGDIGLKNSRVYKWLVISFMYNYKFVFQLSFHGFCN